MYQNRTLAINLNDDINFHPRQQQVMNLIKKPTLRGSIWVKGQRDNEGKIWFQKYVQSLLLGLERVIQLDLILKTPSVTSCKY